MSYFYTYLISSLPTLAFEAKPPFSFEEFISHCQEFIPQADIQILKNISLNADYSRRAHPTLKRWQDFDSALRNELVKIRASRMHIDPVKYLREGIFSEPFISNVAISASRNPSLLEAEKILDSFRWQVLDELCFNHYFDIDFLIIYCLKLLILERWESVNTQERAGVLEEALRSH